MRATCYQLSMLIGLGGSGRGGTKLSLEQHQSGLPPLPRTIGLARRCSFIEVKQNWRAAAELGEHGSASSPQSECWPLGSGWAWTWRPWEGAQAVERKVRLSLQRANGRTAIQNVGSISTTTCPQRARRPRSRLPRPAAAPIL